MTTVSTYPSGMSHSAREASVRPRSVARPWVGMRAVRRGILLQKLRSSMLRRHHRDLPEPRVVIQRTPVHRPGYAPQRNLEQECNGEPMHSCSSEYGLSAGPHMHEDAALFSNRDWIDLPACFQPPRSLRLLEHLVQAAVACHDILAGETAFDRPPFYLPHNVLIIPQLLPRNALCPVSDQPVHVAGLGNHLCDRIPRPPLDHLSAVKEARFVTSSPGNRAAYICRIHINQLQMPRCLHPVPDDVSKIPPPVGQLA